MKHKNLKITSIIIIGLAIPFWVLWKNIFPSFEYDFNLNQDNRNKISEKILNGKKFIIYPVDILDTKGDYFFDRVILNLEFKENLESEITVKAIDGSETLLYPIGESIKNKDQLNHFLQYENESKYPNGSIFSFNGSAYLVSKGQYLPIFSADVFTRSGFHWNNLINVDRDTLTKLREGEKFHYYSPHPDNTIVRINKDNYYLIWEKQLLSVENSLLSETWPDFNWADIEENKTLTGECSQSLSKREVHCNYYDESKRIGNSYIFEIENQTNHIEKVNIKMKTSLKKDLRETLVLFKQRIKNGLIYKYGKYL